MATICPHCGEDIEAIKEEVASPRAIVRGICWDTSPRNSAYRLSSSRYLADNDLGLRLVLPLPQ